MVPAEPIGTQEGDGTSLVSRGVPLPLVVSPSCNNDAPKAVSSGVQRRRQVFHRSERLLLRPHWPEDWQAVYAGINDEGVVRNLSRAPWPYLEDHAREFAMNKQSEIAPRFAITVAATDELIGCIGLDPVEQDKGTLELGYWIARKAWGQGFATEAGRAVIDIARMMGSVRLEAGHYVDNPASGKVLRKLGFVRRPGVQMRHSLGRGEDVPTAEYALDLEEELAEVRKAA